MSAAVDSSNPPAFPSQPCGVDGLPETEAFHGMTLRDWFAGQVLPVVAADIAQDRSPCGPQEMPRLAANGAYLYADAMLAARVVQP